MQVVALPLIYGIFALDAFKQILSLMTGEAFGNDKERGHVSGGVRVRFRVRFQAVKVPILGGFPVENPTKRATASKLF